MDVAFLLEFIDPIILGICLLVGYVLKTAFDKFPNKYIPLAALLLGTTISILVNLQIGISPEIILQGMISGLASTGAYELLKNLIWKNNEKGEN